MSSLLARHRKVLGFVVSGTMAGGVYALVLVLVSNHLHIPVFFASLLAFCAAIPVSYFGNRWISYRSRNVIGAEMSRFIVVQVFNLLITSAMVHFAIQFFALSTYAGIVIAFIAAPIVSFVLFELWVYRQ